ncbi:MAG: hypothetical protein IPN94_28120 [Sphingobacteriales bacterium]|nr:hypothetical protein [Sphingobacteriales bacterium]
MPTCKCEYTLAYTDTPKRYTLQNWIALNQQNYREYQQIEELIDRRTPRKITCGTNYHLRPRYGLANRRNVLP